MFDHLSMDDLALLNGIEMGAGFEKEGEGVGIWGEGGIEHLGEQVDGMVGRRGTNVASDHGVPNEDIWGVDSGENGVGVVHGA